MDKKYADWIAEFERRQCELVTVVGLQRSDPTYVNWAVKGMCASATEDMVAAFPELRRVRGHYGYAQHWWCVAPDGSVVDPTARQFKPGFAYEEYSGPDPLGKCMNCGDLIWEARWAPGCCEDCLMALKRYYDF